MVETLDGLEQSVLRTRREQWVIVAKVTESAPTANPPLDYVFLRERFMKAIGMTAMIAATRAQVQGRSL